MELYQIKSFIEIARIRNLTKAADILNISQSALSSQIKALESYLGVSLFERTAKGMVLTSSGDILLSNAKIIVQGARDMEQKASDLRANVHGTLNIGINTEPQFIDVFGIRREVLKILPKVKINFVESQAFETREMLLQEKIDTGFHFDKIEDLSVHSIELLQVEICVVMPLSLAQNENDLSIEKIAALPWIWTEQNCPFHNKFKQAFENQFLEFNQVTDAVEEHLVRELVKSGTGLALMRKDEALELKKHGHAMIWKEKDFVLKIPLNIICLSKRKNEKLICAFMNLIQEKYKAI
jgi:DNA-binding transcriptional LysR family regulator